MTKPYWSVTVSVDGEEVLTIEPDMLSGVPEIDAYEDVIRECARHLMAFIGKGPEE